MAVRQRGFTTRHPVNSKKNNNTAVRNLKTNKYANIAVWSSQYNDFNGQSIVTKRVIDNVVNTSDKSYEFLYLKGFGIKSFVSWLYATLSLYIKIVFRGKTLYVVCSRSNVGLIRDIPPLFLSKIGVRVIVHVHGSDIVGLLKEKSISPMARLLYRDCELVVPSWILAELLADVSFKRLHVCENFALPSATDEFAEGPNGRSPLRILWNSNVMASKGVFEVASAVVNMNTEDNNFKLQLLGAVLGDEEMSRTDAIRELEKYTGEKNIVYCGPVDAETARKKVEHSDVIALPSRYASELQPLAIIQGMCAGKGIVISDTPALRTTVGDYPAEVVSVKSSAELMGAFQKLNNEIRAGRGEFFARRADAAVKARHRFSGERFDREMRSILFNSPCGPQVGTFHSEANQKVK